MADRRKLQQEGSNILVFLDRHRLAHTPEHYAFGHEYLNGSNDQLRSMVDEAIDGGVRLTEDRVRSLYPTGLPQNLMPQFDHITLRVMDVVGDALSITSDLNRELVLASAALLDAPEGGAGPLIATMLRRAEQAEASFAQAARRARDIRAELTAMQTAGQHDRLTGVANRAAFEVRLAERIGGPPACLAFVDIDGLRAINDSHTAAVGDRLLKVVARTLTEHCRGQFVARWHGGTFAILVDDPALRSAGELVSRACETISARDMTVRENDQPLGRVTLSAGVVALRSRDMEGMRPA